MNDLINPGAHPELEVKLLEAQINETTQSAAYHEARSRAIGKQERLMDLEWENIQASELEQRIYAFDGTVSANAVQAAIVHLGQWQRRNPELPIKLVFNSPGGDVFNGLALYDYIKELQALGTRVDTTALGMAASMGGILLQAGDERVMSKHSYLLIHEIQDILHGNASELEDQFNFARRLQNRLLSILAERSKLDEKEIQAKWKRKDWWLDAYEAHDLGFCDRIV